MTTPTKVLKHCCVDYPKQQIELVRKYHRPTRHQYRALLMIAGVMLYLVHQACPEYEITVTLLIHGMVTLDPTV
jgi:hypothetical protein